MRSTFLYRFFDAEGKLLYIGMSYHMENRLDSHRFSKPWDRISRIQIEQFPTREKAAAAEREAILSEGPEWNVIYVPLFPVQSSRPRRRPSYYQLAKERWSDAEWVSGNGRFASVAHCRVLTVALYESEDAALKAKSWIDRCGCGGFCAGNHEIVDLDKVRV